MVDRTAPASQAAPALAPLSLSERAVAAAFVERVIVDRRQRRRALRSTLIIEGVVGFALVLARPMAFEMAIIVVTVVVLTVIWHLVAAAQRRARFAREVGHAGFDVAALREAVDVVSRDLPVQQAVQRAVKDTDDRRRLRSRS